MLSLQQHITTLRAVTAPETPPCPLMIPLLFDSLPNYLQGKTSPSPGPVSPNPISALALHSHHLNDSTGTRLLRANEKGMHTAMGRDQSLTVLFCFVFQLCQYLTFKKITDKNNLPPKLFKGTLGNRLKMISTTNFIQQILIL